MKPLRLFSAAQNHAYDKAVADYEQGKEEYRGFTTLTGYADFAVTYAAEVKGRWPEIELMIANYDECAHYYAQYVLKGRFLLYEKQLDSYVAFDTRRRFIAYADALSVSCPDAWHEYEMERGAWKPA